MGNNLSIGSWITLAHFSIAEIMAKAGFDWLCIDLEHSVIDYYEAEQLIATIESNGCLPYVRVGANDQNIIKRVLDAGAKGIIVPMINSKEDAKKAVAAAKYPPTGKRGVGLARAQGYGFGFEEYVGTINNRVKVIAQVEHHEAIENLDEILSVEGVDGTIIGPYDLSGSIGLPGQFDHPDVKKLLNRYEFICKEKSSPTGFHVVPADYKLVKEKINTGYTFIAFSLDTIFLGTQCRLEMDKLKKYRK
ncbi:MAG: 2,4-dihydroxyhept-2-ene-1,7-dioic acid aldolase [Candidatus Marinimicrobia bacterium]|nr:2,4-dihydroxyhept-2-ene-1,7-dioic acid aldolase [Candidatus Neomarinimicrobiota bacterium]|tara:strand:+ start:5672 stop:6415 length:744 start_codon:yes stop_codon:yes gene_type:complete